MSEDEEQKHGSLGTQDSWWWFVAAAAVLMIVLGLIVILSPQT